MNDDLQQETPRIDEANRTSLRYPSDLSDAEWAIVESIISPASRGGSNRSVKLREVLNGIFYVLWTGCQWNSFPQDLPPKSTVQDYLELWKRDGTLESIHRALYVEARKRYVREASPSTAIVDSCGGDKPDHDKSLEASDGTTFQTSIDVSNQYVEVFDNVLREDELADLLASAVEMRRRNRVEYHWFSFDESPKDALVSTIANVARRLAVSDSLAGVEYWCVVLEKGECVDWHFDKDEGLFIGSRGKKIICPKWSFVCYLDTTDLVGGAIEIEGIGLIEPRVGRCVKMPGTLRHGVKRVVAGRRVSLVLNLWTSIPRAYQLSTTSIHRSVRVVDEL